MCCGALASNGNLNECENGGAAAWANDGALNTRFVDSRGGNWWQLASGLLSWTATYPPLAACAPPPCFIKQAVAGLEHWLERWQPPVLLNLEALPGSLDYPWTLMLRLWDLHGR